MSTYRIALANLPYPESPESSVEDAVAAIGRAAEEGAAIVCFPECFVPGYRTPNRDVPPADQAFLDRAWARVAEAAKRASVAVVLGTERVVDGRPRLCALVVSTEGEIVGVQDKVQLDPSEEAFYAPGDERRLFRAGPLAFGVAICHEGWRYPETVRWAARRGAHVVFHPHFHEHEPGDYVPMTFGDPLNTFHEKALLCRAAENTVYVASVNFASAGSPTTSTVANPDGTLLAYRPYGEAGLLVVDVDLDAATGLLARRCRTEY